MVVSWSFPVSTTMRAFPPQLKLLAAPSPKRSLARVRPAGDVEVAVAGSQVGRGLLPEEGTVLDLNQVDRLLLRHALLQSTLLGLGQVSRMQLVVQDLLHILMRVDLTQFVVSHALRQIGLGPEAGTPDL